MVQGGGGRGAATLTIPGFTHPVRDLFLEDVLEATGFAVGRGSRWAKRATPQASFQVRVFWYRRVAELPRSMCQARHRHDDGMVTGHSGDSDTSPPCAQMHGSKTLLSARPAADACKPVALLATML